MYQMVCVRVMDIVPVFLLEMVVRKASLVRPSTIVNRSTQILAYADDIGLMRRSEQDVA